MMSEAELLIKQRILNGKKLMEEEIVKNVLFLDTETNGEGGFKPPRHDIVQLAWIYNGCVNSFYIKGATKMNSHVPHDISLEFLDSNGTEFEKVWPEFKKDFKQAEKIVSHNLDFDIGILVHALESRIFSKKHIDMLNEKAEKIGVCTMKKATGFCKIPKTGYGAKYPGWKWPTLTEWYKVLFSNDPLLTLHDAKNDCVILKECFAQCEALDWKSPVKKYYRPESALMNHENHGNHGNHGSKLSESASSTVPTT